LFQLLVSWEYTNSSALLPVIGLAASAAMPL